LRRLRAIRDMAPEERPVPIKYISKQCGFQEDEVKHFITGYRQITDWRQIRLSKFLIDLENGKYGTKPTRGVTSVVGIALPNGKPPEKTVVCYDVSDKGVKLRFGKINPNKFGHD